jgi:hypothetical protein
VSIAPEAFKVPALSNREMWAIRMLEEGTADPHNQRLALSAILSKLCRTYDIHFVPESERETAFLEGRGFVGQQITKVLRIDPNALNAMTEEEKNGR